MEYSGSDWIDDALAVATRYGSVPMDVEVVADSRRMTMAEIADFEPGKVIPLTRSVDKEVQIFANHKFIGHGEIITVNDRLAVRVTALEEGR